MKVKTEPNPAIEYRLLAGYSRYAIGRDGTVWRRMKRVVGGGVGHCALPMEQWTELRPFIGNPRCNHPMVVLYPDAGNREHWQVKRLVAICFVPNPESYAHVRLILWNGGNVADNLKWYRGKEKVHRKAMSWQNQSYPLCQSSVA